jgi:MoaA/NifB/PqqE/SkfB family radical SAM enzyme
MNRVIISWSVSLFCNLNCEYCIVDKFRNDDTNKFSNFDVDAAIKFVNGFKMPVTIHFTGGEPLVDKNVIKFISWLTNNGHYATVNTNLTVNIDNFINEVNFKNIESIMISFHIDELLRTNKMQVWLTNYQKIKNKCNTGVTVIAYPKYSKNDVIEYDELYKKKLNIPYIYVPYIGEYNEKTYPAAYEDDEIKYFSMNDKMNCSDERVRYNKSNVRYCNAGKKYFAITYGHVKMCLGEPFGSLGTIETFDFSKINTDGYTKCEFDFCPCPNFSNTFYK